jgi:hypothetical protein
MLSKLFTHDPGGTGAPSATIAGRGISTLLKRRTKGVSPPRAERAKTKTRRVSGLLVVLFTGLVGGLGLHATGQTVPGNDSAHYVHDDRTYGIRYVRGWFDTALVFPRNSDTTMGTGQGHPSLYTTGFAQNQLWWNNGNGRNFQIGGVVGAANGNQLDGNNVIMGYATSVPNLYRDVSVTTGQTHSWGVNADSTFFANGTINRNGGFFGVGPDDGFSSGPNWQAGFNDSVTGNNQNLEAAGYGFAYSGAYASGATGALDFLENEFLFNVQDVTGRGGGYNYTLGAFPATVVTSTQGYQLTSLNTSGGGVIDGYNQWDYSWWFYSDSTADRNVFGVDGLNSIHFRHLNCNGDSILGVGSSITVEFGPNLGITPGPSGYSIKGYDAAFILSFQTGLVVPGGDTTDAVIRISLRTGSENSFVVTGPTPYGAPSGLSNTAISPWIKVIDNQTFEVHASVSNYGSVGFTSGTWYSFGFHVIDY